MNDQQFFLNTSLSYQLRAARREPASFRSGEAYVRLRTEYERVIRDQDLTIKKLQKERDGLSFSRKEITRQWLDVLEDLQKEHEKEVRRLKKAVTELLDIVASLKNRNAKLDAKRKKFIRPNTKNVILVDSVINTGKTIRDILEPDMFVACCVINEKAVSLFDKQLYTIRVSGNFYVGSYVAQQVGTQGSDTTMRLFNLI